MDVIGTMDRLGAYDMYPDTPANEEENLAELRDLEKQIGCEFPDEYRSFVMNFGQYGFDRRICCPSGEGSPCGPLFRVTRWFGLRKGGRNLLRKEIKTYRGRIPDHAIPVAADPGGNLLVLSLFGDDRGFVYSWDHEFRALGWNRLKQWTDDLERDGVDVSRMAAPEIIREWERRHAESLNWRPGYGNLYRVARTWGELMASLQEYPE